MTRAEILAQPQNPYEHDGFPAAPTGSVARSLSIEIDADLDITNDAESHGPNV
jgi:hypothetical protein